MATKLQATNPQATKSQAVNRETIANLSKNHEAVQRLFTTIASVLMTAPKRDLGLCDEWDRLTKTYHDLYRQSQLNASTCADFLGTLETSLAPLSSDSGDRVIKARRQTIKAVIEMITVHHESAQTNSWKFYELADEVEKFSYKALDALEPKAEGGFWANLWSGAASRYQLIRENTRASYNANLREAKKACLPLIACLREYSRGGHPE
ncbi:hypothetical protein PHLCEN_2v3006 [Hermanssonia centrifuga]|uniref:Uncharacterized protein n=1 Tax=Hermanssonia centrifuga TaxID=98765 RepID=A0A2R6R7F2_9APHY|nr:hypothetical protein PHLCEN_2v3006 [Hermanssonia centrifuga]